MSDTQSMSRRTSVKSLMLMGAALAAGAASGQSEEAPRDPGLTTGGPDTVTPAPQAVELAMARFAKGHSCSQAVFTTFAEQDGLGHEPAMKIAAGFGGGMWSGSVCGAVSGAYMALGLRYGGDPMGAMAKLVKEFNDRFKAKHRSIVCSELLGVDLSQVDFANPEQVKALKERIMKEKNPYLLCGSFVRDAAAIVDAMSHEAQPEAKG